MAEPKIAALILAAGRAQRMGENKLLLLIDGRSLIARTADTVLASAAATVIVVTGHDGDLIRAALAERPLRFVDNPGYHAGLSTSLRTGIAALGPDIDGAIVCLGDMPAVTTDVVDTMIAGFDPGRHAEIVAPICRGKRGNPVLWGKRFFAELLGLSGDTGGKSLLERYPGDLHLVPVDDDGVLIDIDTPDALAQYRDRIESGRGQERP